MCAQILEPAGPDSFRAIMSLSALPLALSSSNASLFGLLVLLLFFGSRVPRDLSFSLLYLSLFVLAVFYGAAVPCTERC
jgi:hypothetical protein